MAIFLANGEWAEGSLKVTTYDDAVGAGVREFADTRHKTTFGRERTMVCRGIATYIEIPDEFEDEISSNHADKPTTG
ncbi:hypothetical protein Cme02nite_49000 [Catellatospora methionotrophica]|uniref:Uncharacterized protein n=1 Tax=Catellatospora methionotrophica TaxID=121620 RepID=A0A8J3L8Y8_9ACTN|nr:hypothetical protein [Catellatospora methionotrophica]GIG16568.1 hypothetical protein Cme02nite_49000 [Catellatospora methionotrophica]